MISPITGLISGLAACFRDKIRGRSSSTELILGHVVGWSERLGNRVSAAERLFRGRQSVTAEKGSRMEVGRCYVGMLTSKSRAT